jgi:HSP20 family protein
MATRFVPLSQFDRLASSFFAPARPQLDRQIPLDAVQRDDRLVLQFDLPGVAEENVELSLERRVLSVRAERQNAVRPDDAVFVAERPWGAMSRQIVLGDTLDLEKVTASFANGVLTVSIPVATTAKSRRIEIGHAPIDTNASVDGADAPAPVEAPAPA